MRATCSTFQARNPARALIALTLIAGVAAGLVWLLGSYPPSFEVFLRTEAFGSRPTRGRLSWNPYYAPYRPEPLGATPVPALKRYPEILAASGKVALRAESQGS